MKKIFNFAMMGAIALTGAMTFTACSSDDEAQAPVNPTFDGESVKATFSISVGDVKSTRMSNVSVQADNQFHGMTDIYLFPAKEAITGSTAFKLGYINLPAFNDFDAGTTSQGSLTTAQAKRYKDVSFAIGTNNFLFYAATADGNKDNGALKPSYLEMTANAADFLPAWNVTSEIKTSTTPADIKFDLVPYQMGKTLADVKTAGASTVLPLNEVYKLIREKANAAASADPAKTDIQTRLNNLCDTLKNGDRTTANTPQAFAGSALSIQELIEDIYNKLFIDATTLETLSDDDKLDYNTYYDPITDKIEEYFNASLTAATGNYDLTWKVPATNDFPKTALNVPDGGVAVIYQSSEPAVGVDGWSTYEPFDYTEPSVDGMVVANIDKYVHPARLYYTINSPAKVKNATYLYDNTALTGKSWSDILADYTNGTAVTTATQSVVMEKQVQYAVARLDVRAQVKTGKTILDSGSGLDGSADKDPQPVVVPAEGYELTGVLIGNQKQVDWEFHPITGSGITQYTIYDNHMTTDHPKATVGGYSDVNHTLALETEANTSINIALEFLNTGNDFYGKDHKLIPAGSKFYLVATLNPTGKSVKEQNSETPWAETTTVINQVLKQDYTTVADMTIGENSLKSAYNIVPDLRSTKLEFGLSVDLHWRTGITFEQEF